MTHATSDAAEILEAEFGDDAEYRALLAQERLKSQAARAIYAARTAAGLTQKELAIRIGTTQSVISRLEDGDYDKHSLAMLERVARALNQQVEVRFLPRPNEESSRQSNGYSINNHSDTNKEYRNANTVDAN